MPTLPTSNRRFRRIACALLCPAALVALAACASPRTAPAASPPAASRLSAFCSTFTEQEAAYTAAVHAYAHGAQQLTLDSAVQDAGTYRGFANTLITNAPSDWAPEVEGFLGPWLQLNTAASSREHALPKTIDTAAFDRAREALQTHCASSASPPVVESSPPVTQSSPPAITAP